MSDIDLTIGYNAGNSEQVVNKLTAAEEKHEQAVKRNQWAIDRAAKAEEKLNQARISGIRNAMGAVAQAAQTQVAHETKTNANLAAIVNNYKALRMAAAGTKIDEIFARGTAASETHARSVDRVAGATGAFGVRVSDVAKAFVAWKGIEGILDAVKSSIVGADERLSGLAGQLDKRAGGFKLLAASQPSGAAAVAVTREASDIAGLHDDVTDQEAAQMLLESQKVTGDPGKRSRMAEQMATLKDLGVSAEESISTVRGGVKAGLSPEQASALGFRTKQTTGLDLGKASEISQRFKTPYEGAAIMTEINRLGGYKTEKAQLAAIERVQEGLNEDPRVKTNRFARYMASQARMRGSDWTKLSESEKLEAIAQVMPDTSAGALEKRGMQGETAREVSRLVAHRAEIRGLLAPPGAGFLAGARAIQESVPDIHAKEAKEGAEGLNLQIELNGPTAARARDYGLRTKAAELLAAQRGRRLEETGHPYMAATYRYMGSSNLAEQMTGAPPNLGYLTRHKIFREMEEKAPGRSGAEWLDRVNSSLQREAGAQSDPAHTDAVRENTEALHELNSSLRSGDGGRASGPSSPRRNAALSGERH